MKKFKIGDRVKIKSTGKTGMIGYIYPTDNAYAVYLDIGSTYKAASPSELTRLRKKKKTVSKKECKLGNEAPLPRQVIITKEQLAKLWNLYIWCVPSVSNFNATESKVFEKICKELGF